MELNKEINALKGKMKIAQGKIKLAQIAGASEDSWELIKESEDSARDSLKAAANDAKAKFKD